MIRITIDIVPYGVEEDTRNIHTLTIANMGKAEEEKHRYSVCLDGEKLGEVLHWRPCGMLALIKKAFSELI